MEEVDGNGKADITVQHVEDTTFDLGLERRGGNHRSPPRAFRRVLLVECFVLWHLEDVVEHDVSCGVEALLG